MDAPDEPMMRPIEAIARFMATGDATRLDATFTDDATIFENFAPFIFTGDGAVARWAKLFRAHVKNLSDLTHSFGPAQDFRGDGTLAYLSLPTTWAGKTRGQPFHETGGWAFLLKRQTGAWRVKMYAWAVTNYEKR
jgi:ketosteroid isomerase-like protein